MLPSPAYGLYLTAQWTVATPIQLSLVAVVGVLPKRARRPPHPPKWSADSQRCWPTAANSFFLQPPSPPLAHSSLIRSFPKSLVALDTSSTLHRLSETGMPVLTAASTAPLLHCPTDKSDEACNRRLRCPRWAAVAGVLVRGGRGVWRVAVKCTRSSPRRS